MKINKGLHRTRYSLSTALLFVLVLLFFIRPSAQAQNTPGLSFNLEAGFDGWYKSTYWLPVHISAANSGPAIDGELRLVISDGPGNETIYTTPLDLPTQSDKRVTMIVKAPRNLTSLEVNLVANGRSVGSDTTRTGGLRDLPAHTLLYGVVTPDAGSFDFLADVDGRRGETAVAYLSPHHLPDIPPAWNSLDVLILHDTDSGQFSPVQRQALAGWIQSGGHLVVVGGPGWQPTSSGLADWLPVTPHTLENINSLPALSQQAGMALEQPGPYLVTNSSLRQGELLWHQEGLPLLARRSWGQGSVYFLALDPTLVPLRGWAGQPILWQSIAGQLPDLTPWSQGVQNGRAAVTAVSTLAQRTLPTAGTLILFMLIYILLIGPVNYQVLKRRGQREMAWVTIPILVLIFSAIAYATGFGLRGNAPILNQMSIVIGQAGGDYSRVQTIIGLYSPSRTSYELVLPETVVVRPIDRNSSNVRSSSGHIIRDSRLAVSNIRTDIGSVEAFLADSYQPGPDLEAVATMGTRGSDMVIDLTVVNNGRFALEGVAVIAGNQVEMIGDLPAAASRSHQINLGSVTATSPALIPVPGSSGFAVPQSPLLTHSDTLLGGWSFRDDPDTAAKRQMFEALENFSMRSAPATVSPHIFLVAWSDEPMLSLSLDHNRTNHLATTLYLLDIPVQQFSGSDQISLPADLVDRIVLNRNLADMVGNGEILLSGGWVELEYTPWPLFQGMQVATLDIVLQPRQSGNIPPAVSLWHWAGEEWVTETAVNWGNTPIIDPSRYLNHNNSIRLRLEDQDNNTVISLVYPRLTGEVAR